MGLFARYSRADGKTETYAFAEVDASLSGGLIVKGRNWSRADDEIGIGFARNQLSASRREYLGAGGLSIFLGDGKLAYKPEQIVEAYYSMAVTPHFWASLGAQRIANPGYNAARGPASFGGLRLHLEY